MNDEQPRRHVTFYYDNGSTYTARNVGDIEINLEENQICYEFMPQAEVKGNGTVLEIYQKLIAVKAQDIHTLVIKEGNEYTVKRLKESSVVDIMVTTRKETNMGFILPEFDSDRAVFPVEDNTVTTRMEVHGGIYNRYGL